MAKPLKLLGIPISAYAVAAAVVTLLPLVFLLTVLVLFHIDAPYLDQWEFVPFLEKAYSGTLSPFDFWAQHNEHRLVFPRLFFLLLAWLTRWDIRWELAANVVMGMGLFAVLAYNFVSIGRYSVGISAIWTFPFISALVFSMSQWENWTFGWQFQEFLTVLAATSGIFLLANPRSRWPAFGFAMLLGVVASYSFASGLAYWPVAAVAMVLAKPPDRNGLSARRVIWLAISVATITSYLYGYQTPEHHPPTSAALARPVEFIVYILKYIGAPVVSWNGHLAAIVGLLGITTFTALAVHLLNSGGAPVGTLAPHVCLALFALASGVMAGIGRLGFGSNQAMSPRYITFAQLLWVGSLGLAYLTLAHAARFKPTPQVRRKTVAVALVFLGLLAVNSFYGAFRWSERWAYRRPAQQELVRGDNPALLVRLHPDPSLVIERREILREHRLSLFRDLP